MKTKNTLLALLLVILVSCKNTSAQKTENMTDLKNKTDFGWSATITNPHGYPVEIHEGYLADEKQPIASFVNTGTIDQGWNYNGDGITGGNIIPTNFSLTWLGYADKKFWKAQGKLPSDLILKLFQEGYLHTDMAKVRSKITYKHITFGLTPGGMVVVWLTGYDKRVEIAHFQAIEADVDINTFWRNPDYLTKEKSLEIFYNAIPAETKTYIKAHGLPIGKWEKYRKRYNYRFVSQLYKPTAKERFDRQIKYFNGEEEILQEGELLVYKERAIPYHVDFYYLDDKLEWGEAYFDDQEMMQVFETLSQKHPNEPIDIVAKVGFEYSNLAFKVVCGNDSIELKKARVEHMSGAVK